MQEIFLNRQDYNFNMWMECSLEWSRKNRKTIEFKKTFFLFKCSGPSPGVCNSATRGPGLGPCYCCMQILTQCHSTTPLVATDRWRVISCCSQRCNLTHNFKSFIFKACSRVLHDILYERLVESVENLSNQSALTKSTYMFGQAWCLLSKLARNKKYSIAKQNISAWNGSWGCLRTKICQDCQGEAKRRINRGFSVLCSSFGLTGLCVVV